jgi:general stress protein CsbA
MKGYFTKFFILYFLIILGVGLAQFAEISFRTDIALVLLLLLVFHSLDAKYPAVRRAALAAKLDGIFSTEAVSEGVVRFRLNAFDLFASVELDYKKGFQFANVETISFHIPADQLERLAKKPDYVFLAGKVGAIPTFIIHQTDGNGLVEARNELENML